MWLAEFKEWDKTAFELRDREKSVLKKRIREITSNRYFFFMKEEDWKSKKSEAAKNVRDIYNALSAIKDGTEDGYMDALIYYLDGDGERIFDERKISRQNLNPNHIAQVWATSLAHVGIMDVGRFYGNASFDLSLSKDSDVYELWAFTGVMIGYIAFGVYDVLKGNPFQPLFEIYKAGLRLLLENELIIAAPVIEQSGDKCYHIYRTGEEAFEFIGKRVSV